MKKISAVINARTTSQRCPNKLIRSFYDDKSLFDISLEKLSQCNFFYKRYVAVAEDVFEKKLVDFPSLQLLKRSMDSIKPGYNDHDVIYAHYKNIECDYIFWINPCHALLSIETLEKAFNIVQNTNYNSYTSVIKFIDWIFDQDGKPLTITNPNSLSSGHSQHSYKMAHAFHIFKKDYFLENKRPWSMKKNDPHNIEIPFNESFDVNEEYEFNIAQNEYKLKHE